MFFLGLAFFIFGIILFIAGINEMSDGMIGGAIFSGIIGVVIMLVFLNVSLSTKNLTGYVYSSEDRFGYTTAHIRFSENAGTDAQPEFCYRTNSPIGKKLAQYVGSDKKVSITIQPYFYVSNNPFQCGTDNMTVKEIKG